MAKAVTLMSISRKKRRVFLDILGQTGSVSKSSQAVGYTSPAYLHKMRQDDKVFAAEWDEAVEVAKYNLEAIALDRIRNGIMEPVYYKGKVVGHTPKYNDQLLMFVLRKLDPNYRDTHRIGDVNIKFGVAVLPMTAVNEDEWEKRAVEMHSNQEVIELEAKDVTNHMERIQRGD